MRETKTLFRSSRAARRALLTQDRVQAGSHNPARAAQGRLRQRVQGGRPWGDADSSCGRNGGMLSFLTQNEVFIELTIYTIFSV